MANNEDFLDFTGLGYFKGRLDTAYPSKEEFNALDDKVDEIISEGGEPNVIEVIKVDNTPLTPDAQKAVNIDLSGKADTDDIPTKLSELTNDGDGTANSKYATEKYVDDNGGKIDVIKKNGTAQTISNKEVDLAIPDIRFSTDGKTFTVEYTGKSDTNFTVTYRDDDTVGLYSMGQDGDPNSAQLATKDYVDENGGKIDVIKVNGATQTITNKEVDITMPTDLSDLTNTGADPYAQISDVESAVVGALKPKGSVAFADLPQLTAANLNSMYNVTDEFTTTIDFVEGAGKTYPAGTNVAIINVGTDQNPVYKYDCYTGVMDLSGYWAKTELTAITAAQIDSLFE